jgi:hypothetical protein
VGSSGRWLERSGQHWKIRYANVALYLGFALLVIAFIGPRALAGFAGVLAFVFLGASLTMPLLVRCQVCGLHLQTSTMARSLSQGDRSRWVEDLEACPVCEDDGRAMPESRTQWVNSGASKERPYWSSARVLLAVILAFLLLAGSLLIANLRNKKTLQELRPSQRSWYTGQSPRLVVANHALLTDATGRC